MNKCVVFAVSTFLAGELLLSARTYEVGRDQEFKTIKEVASKVQPGDEVLVYPGIYKEAVFWRGGSLGGDPITVRGVGDPRPVIDGVGVSVAGASGIPRALFEIYGDNYIFENLEIRNARNGHNGAGIRLVGAHRTVFRHILVRWNDMGFMSVDNDDLLVEHSEIAWNGTPEFNGFSHNFYIEGNRAVVRYCYIHDATNGQVFKAKSRYVELMYNYIADAHDRIEFGDTTKEVGLQTGEQTDAPNSHAVLIGNIIVKRGQGVAFLDFGPEDTDSARNGTLYMINNTVVREGNAPRWFLRLGNTVQKAVLYNNIFYAPVLTEFSRGDGGQNITGSSNWFPSGTAVPASLSDNIFGTDPGFIDVLRRDYRLRADSPLIDRGSTDTVWFNADGEEQRRPLDRSYLPHMEFGVRASDGVPDLGAFELAAEDRAASDINISGHLSLPNGEPLARHTIVLTGPDPRSAITDENGNYQFLSLRATGTYTVRPWGSDVPFEIPFRQIELNGESATADFTTGPLYAVRGKILSRSKRAPLKEVVIYLNGRDSRWTLTDVNGDFRFLQVPGGIANTLQMKHPYVVFDADIRNKPLGELNGDLTLEFLGDLQYAINIFTRDANNVILPGITLELTGTDIPPRIVQTNSRGSWNFTNLPEGGEYEIRIKETPHLFKQSGYSAKNLQKDEVIILTGPPLASLSGIVRRKDGTPVPAATVNLTGSQVLGVRSGIDGSFRFNSLIEGGSYKLSATSSLATFPGNAAEVASLSPTQSPVEIVGTALFTVTVQVLDANDLPVPSIGIVITGSINRSINTDTQGRILVNSVPEGGSLSLVPSNSKMLFEPAKFTVDPVAGPQTVVFRSRPR